MFLKMASTKPKTRAVDWISVQGHAERNPLTFSLTIKLGPLPEGWTKAGRSRASASWAGLLGLALVAPSVALGAAGLLQSAGFHAAYDWFAGNAGAIIAATVSLFIGLPVAFAINIWPITRLGFRRQAGELEGVLALEVAPFQLAVVLVAVLVGGLFAGHLAADSYVCLNGVRSAC
ncbi:MAG: hypothetical protein ACREOM_12020 [Candidatus Dormibacteraceae bacterium]